MSCQGLVSAPCTCIHPPGRVYAFPCLRLPRLRSPVSSLDVLTWVRAEFAELLGKCLGRVLTTSSRVGTAFDDRIYQSSIYFVGRASCLRIVGASAVYLSQQLLLYYYCLLIILSSICPNIDDILPSSTYLQGILSKSLRCKYRRVRLGVSTRVVSLKTTTGCSPRQRCD